MAKSAQRIEARRLRKEIGMAIGKIANKLEVSKSSVSVWCRNIRLTEEQIVELAKSEKDGSVRGSLKAAKIKRDEQINRKSRFMSYGARRVGNLSKRELFVLGSGLYWAEGCKKNRATAFVNSDPGMINIFIRWLKECLKIDEDRIYCFVSINQDHKCRIDDVERYWSRVTGIPRSVFTGVSYKRVKNKKFYANFNNHYGTLFVRVRRGTNLNYEILGYIEGLKKNIG